MWEVLRRREAEPTVGAMAEILAELCDIAAPTYWEKDSIEGAAVFGSMKGFTMLADTIKDELFERGFTTE